MILWVGFVLVVIGYLKTVSGESWYISCVNVSPDRVGNGILCAHKEAKAQRGKE
jgi:hypothetical protein